MKSTKIFSTLLFTALFVGVSSLFAGCNHMIGIHGDGKVIKETRVVPAFDAIDLSGAWDVTLKQGPNQELTVETDANIMPLVRTDVVNGVLRINIKQPVGHTTKMTLYITVKDLKRIDASGAVDIHTETCITVPELTIDASGASDAKLELAVQKLTLDCSGASKIKMNGTATDVRMDLSGASDIFAYELLAETYGIDISGAGNCQISVSKKLRAEVSGAGTIRYKGSPTDIDQEVSGAGSIKKAD
jgi:hypothetical protein